MPKNIDYRKIEDWDLKDMEIKGVKYPPKIEEVKGIVYSLKCKTTGKYYIGQTLSHQYCSSKKDWRRSGIKARMLGHRREMRNHNELSLYVDMRKYGIDDFIIEKVKEYPGNEIDKMDEYEHNYIKEYNSMFPTGYNILPMKSHCGQTKKRVLKYYNITPMIVSGIRTPEHPKPPRPRIIPKPRIDTEKPWLDKTSLLSEYELKKRYFKKLKLSRIYINTDFKHTYVNIRIISLEPALIYRVVIKNKDSIEKHIEKALEYAKEITNDESIIEVSINVNVQGVDYSRYIKQNRNKYFNQTEKPLMDYDSKKYFKDLNMTKIYIDSNFNNTCVNVKITSLVNNKSKKVMVRFRHKESIEKLLERGLNYAKEITDDESIIEVSSKFKDLDIQEHIYEKYIKSVDNIGIEDYEYQDKLNSLIDEDITCIRGIPSVSTSIKATVYLLFIKFSNKKDKRLSFGGRTTPIEKSYEKAQIFVNKLAENKQNISINLKPIKNSND